MSAAVEARARLGALREEFAARAVQRAPVAWARLHMETRCVLVMLAGIDPAGDQDVQTLAARDWREFTPPERSAIVETADALRWQLNGARDLAR